MEISPIFIMRNSLPVKLFYFDNHCKERALSTKPAFSKLLDDYKFHRLVYTQHTLCHMRSKTTDKNCLNNLKLTCLGS